jgi:hypothetical protein
MKQKKMATGNIAARFRQKTTDKINYLLTDLLFKIIVFYNNKIQQYKNKH